MTAVHRDPGEPLEGRRERPTGRRNAERSAERRPRRHRAANKQREPRTPATGSAGVPAGIGLSNAPEVAELRRGLATVRESALSPRFSPCRHCGVSTAGRHRVRNAGFTIIAQSGIPRGNRLVAAHVDRQHLELVHRAGLDEELRRNHHARRRGREIDAADVERFLSDTEPSVPALTG